MARRKIRVVIDTYIDDTVTDEEVTEQLHRHMPALYTLLGINHNCEVTVTEEAMPPKVISGFAVS